MTDHLEALPAWQRIAAPGLLNDEMPEVGDVRHALRGAPLAMRALEAVLMRRALQRAAAGAAAESDAERARHAAHYECLCELMSTLFADPPRRPRTEETY